MMFFIKILCRFFASLKIYGLPRVVKKGKGGQFANTQEENLKYPSKNTTEIRPLQTSLDGYTKKVSTKFILYERCYCLKVHTQTKTKYL